MPEIKLDRSISYLEGTQRVYDEATTLENTKDEVKKIGVTQLQILQTLTDSESLFFRQSAPVPQRERSVYTQARARPSSGPEFQR